MIILLALLLSGPLFGQLKVRITWGHDAPDAAPYYIQLIPPAVAAGYSLEPGEGLQQGAWQTRAGAGDIDGVEFTLPLPQEPPRRLQNLHILWADLIAASDADTARRLS